MATYYVAQLYHLCYNPPPRSVSNEDLSFKHEKLPGGEGASNLRQAVAPDSSAQLRHLCYVSPPPRSCSNNLRQIVFTDSLTSINQERSGVHFQPLSICQQQHTPTLSADSTLSSTKPQCAKNFPEHDIGIDRPPGLPPSAQTAMQADSVNTGLVIQHNQRQKTGPGTFSTTGSLQDQESCSDYVVYRTLPPPPWRDPHVPQQSQLPSPPASHSILLSSQNQHAAAVHSHLSRIDTQYSRLTPEETYHQKQIHHVSSPHWNQDDVQPSPPTYLLSRVEPTQVKSTVVTSVTSRALHPPEVDVRRLYPTSSFYIGTISDITKWSIQYDDLVANSYYSVAYNLAQFDSFQSHLKPSHDVTEPVCPFKKFSRMSPERNDHQVESSISTAFTSTPLNNYRLHKRPWEDTPQSDGASEDDTGRKSQEA
ncbi:hypothetical protein BDP27DRAFT_1425416 [Rhodocollybia butyracea]|uniref:Uncharacterized protein n=1 Tax=Rhodocollybia butyracea TaxID=206335 RepID=A0A9P5PFR9_9AGAR|nr:hypothetical protein BDP27DRAFT_1425416 [Rhodocollybia butyracea]